MHSGALGDDLRDLCTGTSDDIVMNETPEVIPLSVPNTGARERAYLNQCIDNNFVSSVGPFVDRFEAEIAARHGAAQAVAVAAGTMALHAGLVALGTAPGDLVILPGFTFIASANAIAHAGARPWLMDIEGDRWTLDPRELARNLGEQAERREGAVVHRPSGRRIAAIMPVYTLGTIADMDAINAVAADWDLPVLADAAAAVGGTYTGGDGERPLASLARLTAFSFNGNKTITTGGGGALIGNDAQLMARIKHLTTTARRPDIDFYHHDAVGYNYRMTNLAAAVGCAQLERLDQFIAAKRRIRARYDRAFADLAALAPFPGSHTGDSVCWLSGAVVTAACRYPVPDLCRALAQTGIMARPFWKPVHLQPPYADAPRCAMAVTDGLWQKVVTLPSSSGLSEADQDRVIEAVIDLVGEDKR